MPEPEKPEPEKPEKAKSEKDKAEKLEKEKAPAAAEPQPPVAAKPAAAQPEEDSAQSFFGEPLVGFDPNEISGSLIVIEGMDGSGRSDRNRNQKNRKKRSPKKTKRKSLKKKKRPPLPSRSLQSPQSRLPLNRKKTPHNLFLANPSSVSIPTKSPAASSSSKAWTVRAVQIGTGTRKTEKSEVRKRQSGKA